MVRSKETVDKLMRAMALEALPESGSVGLPSYAVVIVFESLVILAGVGLELRGRGWF